MWLNPLKTFSDDNLYLALLHEALHGTVKRLSGHTIAEHVEHRTMSRINPALI